MPRHLLAYAVIAVGLAVPATAAIAQDTKSSDVPKEKKICRNVAVTGTRMPVRNCMTQAEWDAQAKAAQEQFRVDMQNRRNRGGM